MITIHHIPHPSQTLIHILPNLPTHISIFQVKGCASPELGAHILLKLANKAGYEFGSSVVALTHLLHSDVHSLFSSVIKEVGG